MEDFVFSYHKKLTEHFEDQKKTWDWFASAQIKEQQRVDYKNRLLKNTYRLNEDSETNIYNLVNTAKQKLGIPHPITVYQELDAIAPNASISFDGKDIHIVLTGSIINRLDSKELLSVIAHELSHIVFYEKHDGKFEVTDRIINAIANDPRSEDVMVETGRLYRLYTELFCDQGALKVVEDANIVIQALVKVATGLHSVSAENYLKQAYEILEQENVGSNEQTHPKTFTRAVALDKWKDNKKEEEITKLIDNQWNLSKLDLFKQQQLNTFTRQFLQLITKPKWLQSERIFSLCRQYFPNFGYDNSVFIDEKMREQVALYDDSIKEYLSYILLDICFADSSLENAPIAHSLQIAEDLEFPKIFKQISKKETKLTVKELNKLIKKGTDEYTELSESENEAILKDE